jgi:hypothetical protein
MLCDATQAVQEAQAEVALSEALTRLDSLEEAVLKFSKGFS